MNLFRHRRQVVVAAVLLLHLLALWALQVGLLRRAAEVVLPVALLSDIVTPPQPKVEPPPPPPPRPPPQAKRPPEPPKPQAAAQPVALPDPTPPPPTAITGAVNPPTPPPSVTAPVVANAPMAPPAPPAPPPTPAPAPPKLELPSTNADYLQNPPPNYPPMSRRMGEQGRVQVRVLIGIDGLPKKGEIAKSSGFERLDQAALDAVLKWRYVPGKRGGVPEEMAFIVPINFELK
jgi:protein TonB